MTWEPDGAALGSRPRLSVCMMVKNEEKRLPAALASVAPWVDELVVVDTGSTDRTQEIARGFGARIYEHPWANDFSRHRNQSISYARGEWILILDADEELDQATAPLLAAALATLPPVNCLLFELYNGPIGPNNAPIYHPRLFRNLPGFHYAGKVHNKPAIPGQAARTGIRLIHHGYHEDPATTAAKQERRLTMLRAWVAEEPDNPQAHAYLAQALISAVSGLAEAAREAAQALALLEAQGGETQQYPQVYHPLLSALGGLERHDELEAHAARCLELRPEYPDPWYFLVLSRFARGDWEGCRQAVAAFLTAQQAAREHPEWFVFFENLTLARLPLVLELWCQAAALVGQVAEAREAFQRLAAQPGSAEALAKVRRILQARGLPDPVAAEDPLSPAPPAPRPASPAPAPPPAGEGKAAELVARLRQNPGEAAAWRELADVRFTRGDHAGAAALYARAQVLGGLDAAALARLKVSRRRTAGQEPSLREAPPRLTVILVEGLARADWAAGQGGVPGRLAWGSLAGPGEMDLSGLEDWAGEHRLGLFLVPGLAEPWPAAAWSVGGGGEAACRPPELAYRLLAAGWPGETGTRVAQRSRLTAALALPAVEVLVLGLELSGEPGLSGLAPDTALGDWLELWAAFCAPGEVVVLGRPAPGTGGGEPPLPRWVGRSSPPDETRALPELARLSNATSPQGGFYGLTWQGGPLPARPAAAVLQAARERLAGPPA